MLVITARSLLAQVHDAIRSRAVPQWGSAIDIGIVLALIGTLSWLSACSEQSPLGETLAATSRSVSTALPIGASTEALRRTPLPSIENATGPVIDSPTSTSQDLVGADVGIQATELAQTIPGATNVYSLTIHNRGPGPATNIVLIDILPSSASSVWALPARPACERAGQHISCDLGEVNSGATAVVDLDLAAGGAAIIHNGTKTTSVNVELSMPACAIDRGTSQPQVTCHLPQLHPGDSKQIRIGLTVESPLTGTFFHRATVSADEFDPDRSNNQITAPVTRNTEIPLITTPAPPKFDLALEASGPSTVSTNNPFTYTYTIRNQGTADATGVWFEDVVPSDLELIAYAPGLPHCRQRGNEFTCSLDTLDGDQSFTFSLEVSGHEAPPLRIELDPVQPGWPACFVIKERTWRHIIQCEIGVLRPGQEAHVQLVLVAVGTRERTTSNVASITANEVDASPVDNTSAATISIQAGRARDGE